jgi:adenylate cyclase
MGLVAELKRRSVFKVGAAYLVVGWLVVQAASIAFPAFDASPTLMRGFILIVLLGFPVALVLAWAFELTPEGVKLDTAGEGSKRIFTVAVVLVALALGWFLRGGYGPAPGADPGSDGAAADMRSIAVLPFVNMSNDPENEFFADGLSEEILNSLVTIEGLRVTGRTSSFQFKGKNEDLRKVGEALGVATVLEGSVRRAGEKVRITAQLVRAADGFHLWSETYDRDVKDTFAVQLDIAQSVTRALDILLDADQQALMANVGARDVEAFVDHQRAMALFNAAHEDYIDIAKMEQGYAEFGQAIAREPRFAAAYYARTDYYAHQLGRNTGTAAEHSALHARYQEDLAQAARLATAPLQRALIEVDRVLISDDWRTLPKQIEAVLTTGGCGDPVWIDVVGPFVDAERFVAWRQQLRACDPLNGSQLSQVATAEIAAGRPQKALEIGEFLHAHGLSQNLGGGDVQAFLALGQIDEAMRRAAAAPPWLRDFKELQVAAHRGDKPAAQAALARWLATPRAATNISADNRINALVLAGDRTGANAVAAALDANPIGPMMLAAAVAECMCGAPFDLAHTPRFKARLAEAGWAWPPADVMHYKTMER